MMLLVLLFSCCWGDELPPWMVSFFWHLPQWAKEAIWWYVKRTGWGHPSEIPIWREFGRCMWYIYRRMRGKPHEEDYTFWDRHKKGKKP